MPETESTQPAEEDIEVGSRWRRNPPGREVVEVRRVWEYLDEGMTVRAHPTTGGRPIVAPVAYLRKHYARVTPPTAPTTEAQR